MPITNASIAESMNDLLDYWLTFNTEYANWLGGTVGGGPNLDGQYPLTNFDGVEALVDCPAKLSSGVGSYVSTVDASAIAAAASAAAASASASTATTQAGLAATARTNAEAAQTAAEVAETSAVNASVTSTAQAANSAASAVDAAAEVVLAAAQVALAADEVALATAQVALAVTARSAAEDAQNYAEEWANALEDTLISVSAGGNGTTEYSSLHWAAKSAASAVAAAASAATIDTSNFGRIDTGQSVAVDANWTFNVSALGDLVIDRQSASGTAAVAFQNDDGLKGYLGFNDAAEFIALDSSAAAIFKVDATGGFTAYGNSTLGDGTANRSLTVEGTDAQAALHRYGLDITRVESYVRATNANSRLRLEANDNVQMIHNSTLDTYFLADFVNGYNESREQLRIKNSAGSVLLKLIDSGATGGTASNPWIGYYDSTETRLAYVGFGSTGNATFSFVNDAEGGFFFDGGDIVTGENLVLDAKQLVGGVGAETTGGTLNYNDTTNCRSGNGYSLLLSTATNGPGAILQASAVYNHVWNFEYSSKTGGGNICQWGIPYTNGHLHGLKQRSRYSGTWSGWVEYLHTGNGGWYFGQTAYNGGGEVTVSSSAPGSPATGDIWIDTS